MNADRWWMSCDRMTIEIEVDPDSKRIVSTEPLARDWIGRHINKMSEWMEKIGGFTFKKLR